MTKNQKLTLDFIVKYIDQHGYSPSYEDIRVGLGQASKSEVYRSISALERAGYITRIPSAARSIEPTRTGKAAVTPFTYSELCAAAAVLGYELKPIVG